MGSSWKSSCRVAGTSESKEMHLSLIEAPPSQPSWKAGFLGEASMQAYRMNIAQKNVFSCLISSFV
jgi:hypothetical protein